MRTQTAAVLALLLASSGTALTHEAGTHSKVIGTVRSIDPREIVVETTDGKERSIRLDDDTECIDQSADSSCSVVKPGDRVAVTTRGQVGALVADEIRFSSGNKTPSKDATKPDEAQKGGHEGMEGMNSMHGMHGGD